MASNGLTSFQLPGVGFNGSGLVFTGQSEVLHSHEVSQQTGRDNIDLRLTVSGRLAEQIAVRVGAKFRVQPVLTEGSGLAKQDLALVDLGQQSLERVGQVPTVVPHVVPDGGRRSG